MLSGLFVHNPNLLSHISFYFKQVLHKTQIWKKQNFKTVLFKPGMRILFAYSNLVITYWRIKDTGKLENRSIIQTSIKTSKETLVHY